jgi:hypothetical protein
VEAQESNLNQLAHLAAVTQAKLQWPDREAHSPDDPSGRRRFTAPEMEEYAIPQRVFSGVLPLKGRSLFAKRKFSQGEIIFIEKPLCCLQFPMNKVTSAYIHS